MAATAQNAKANTVKSIFSRETSVQINIKAEPSVIWALLTNASDYSRWNSTVISIHGRIAAGEKISLKSTLDPKRTFQLKIKEFEINKRLTWGDMMGTRTCTLEKNESGSVTFSMRERIGGPLFPLFSGMIPSFDNSFERFAADLKNEAETITNSK